VPVRDQTTGLSTGRVLAIHISARVQRVGFHLETLVDMAHRLDVPADYLTVLEATKDDVRTARHRAVRVVNTELLELYWRIGRTILDRQSAEGWGAKVIERLSADLRREFPDMTGLSASNVKYMRQMAAAWPKGPLIGQQAVGQLPWGHVTVLLDKLADTTARDWYAVQAVEYGWSRNVFLNQIENRTYRICAAACCTNALGCGIGFAKLCATACCTKCRGFGPRSPGMRSVPRWHLSTGPLRYPPTQL
jgi:predicted nuclease of restriction endonuclease-like (RecB) superfamily